MLETGLHGLVTVFRTMMYSVFGVFLCMLESQQSRGDLLALRFVSSRRESTKKITVEERAAYRVLFACVFSAAVKKQM